MSTDARADARRLQMAGVGLLALGLVSGVVACVGGPQQGDFIASVVAGICVASGAFLVMIGAGRRSTGTDAR